MTAYKLSIVFLFLFVSKQVSAVEWQMPLANPKDNLHSRLAAQFADEVKLRTQGRVIIQTYPGGKLFKGDQIFGAVKRELVPIGGRLVSSLVAEDRTFELDAIPFLATTYLQAFELYKASKPTIEDILKKKGIKLLYSVPWPPQGIYSTVPIESISDFEGLSFRPYSAMTSALGRLLKTKEYIVPATKLSGSLKKKKIDVIFASAMTGIELSLWKNFKYWYDIQAWIPKDMVVVNLKYWNSLSYQDQKEINRAARSVENFGWVSSKQTANQSKLLLQDKGVAVSAISSEFRQSLNNIGDTLTKLWLGRMGDKGRYLLEKYSRP